MIWNRILSWRRHCKWLHTIFLSWNAFFWGYTSSCISTQNRNNSSHFGIHHYLFWWWWFLLTNQIWFIGYLMWLERLFMYDVFFHKLVPQISPLILFSYHSMILNPYFPPHHQLLWFSLYLVLLIHCALKGLT